MARDLPPKTEIVRPVELGGAQRDLYESLRVAGHAEVRQVIARKGLGGSTITILDALMKLRQVCCDPRLVRGEAATGVRESAKYDVLMELVGQQLAQGRRVLVFSQFASMLELIAEGLTAARRALGGADGRHRRPAGSGRHVPAAPRGRLPHQP